MRPEQRYSKEESFAFFRDVITPNSEMWVAESDAEIVAMMGLEGDELDRLYFAMPAQRKGIGSALLDHAKSLRPDGLQCVTFQRNSAARRFYERQGFLAYDNGVSPSPREQSRRLVSLAGVGPRRVIGTAPPIV